MYFLIPDSNSHSNGNGSSDSSILISSETGRLNSTHAQPVKNSWSARRLNEIGASFHFENNDVAPRVGDCIITSVTKVANHTRLFTDDNRYSRLYKDDLMIGVLGLRYATDAYHANHVDIGSLDILTNAGMIGTVSHQHRSMKSPTKLELKGFLTDEFGNRVNTKDRFFKPANELTGSIRPVFVVGTGMNSGKTTSTARIGQSLSRAGHKVAILKLTGSASHRDVHEFHATGAVFTADFTDYGFPSTYLSSVEELEGLYLRMLHDAAVYAPDVVLIEIADGVYQRETEMLLDSQLVQRSAAGVVLTAACAPSALSIVAAVKKSGWDPIVVTGLITNAPLFVQEFSQRCSTPISATGSGCEDICDRIMSRVTSHQFAPVLASNPQAKNFLSIFGL